MSAALQLHDADAERLAIRPLQPTIVAHPVVRTHRETSQQMLSVNFTQKPYIVGLDRAENAELLTVILDQHRRPEYQVRFSWAPGALALWDNRGAVHYAVRNYGDFPRLTGSRLMTRQRWTVMPFCRPRVRHTGSEQIISDETFYPSSSMALGNPS